ncbi:hypothetical protein WN944_024122 [Citrus x changshan-huyou]|uniref:U3 small nucleolar RNA-associated protein 18 homolog n=1 Tax=Citrus x changshan-huyou TaxID=2935761 RepID=A0AAP0LRV9_9ROSI
MLSINEDDAQFSEESDYEGETWQKKPAWVDEEEGNTIVNIAKVNRVGPVDSRSRDGDPHDGSSDEETGAVVARGHEDVEAVDDILRTDEDLVVKSSAKLSPGLLEFSRLVDANAEDSSNGPINSSIFLEECPVRKASFLPDGSQVIIAGRRKFFYSLDLVKAKVGKIGPLVGREEESLEFFEVLPDPSTIAFVGNEGYILLVSSKTKELIGTLKMNGTVRSLAFANGGKQLLSSGGDGQVYHWDLRTRMSIHKAGNLQYPRCLDFGPGGGFMAVGNAAGKVLLYKLHHYHHSLDEQCYQFWLIFSVLSLELHLFLSDLLNNYVNPFMVEELQCFIPVGTLISAIELGALTPSIQKLMYLTEFSEQHKHES